MTLEEAKQKTANQNNFDSFDRAIRYTFNRPLLQSEYEFIHKLTSEAMELYAKSQWNDAIEAAAENAKVDFGNQGEDWPTVNKQSILKLKK